MHVCMALHDYETGLEPLRLRFVFQNVVHDKLLAVSHFFPCLACSREIHLDYKSDEATLSWEALLVSLKGFYSLGMFGIKLSWAQFLSSYPWKT